MMFAVVWRTVLVLVLMAAPVWAQQTPDSDVSGTEEKAAAPEAGAKEKTEPGVAQATETSGAEPREGAGSVTPPDQYRASEQISDDLSVSFPVDI